MGTLALDIETASPVEEPGPDDEGTEFFELLAVALGYRATESAPIECDVLFRSGGWDATYTAELFDELFAWCDGKSVDRVLTYNGSSFDLKHLGNWAESLDSGGVRADTYSELADLVDVHVDLVGPALAAHSDALQDGQDTLPLWKVCNLEDADDESVWYEDYDFHDGHVTEQLEYDFVRAADVGRVLGEQYVDGIEAGIEHTTTHQELHDLLYDYAIGDVDVLFDLYDAFGGTALDADYGTSLADVQR